MLRFLREAPASWLSDVQNAIVMISQVKSSQVKFRMVVCCLCIDLT
jgi:hypothetical protein